MTDFPLLYKAVLDYNYKNTLYMTTGLIVYISDELPNTREDFNNFEAELYYLPIFRCPEGCRFKPDNLLYFKIENGKLKSHDENDYNLMISDKIEDNVQLTEYLTTVSLHTTELVKKRDVEDELVFRKIIDTS